MYFSAEAANMLKLAKVMRQNQQRMATAIDRAYCTGSVLTLTNDNVELVTSPTPKRVAPAVPASKVPPPPTPDRCSSLPKNATGASAYFPADLESAASATLPKSGFFGRTFGKKTPDAAGPQSLELVPLVTRPTISDPIPIFPASLDNWQN